VDALAWDRFTATFSGAGIKEHWQAFFNAVSLFRKLARIVGEGLGYAYPMQMDKEMTEYFTHIRNYKLEAHEDQKL
jgi:aminoglycoside 6-adenylyltransferase